MRSVVLCCDGTSNELSLHDIYPKLHHTRVSANQYTTELRPNLFRPRRIPEDATLHESVVKRVREVEKYRPCNLRCDEIERYAVEPW